MTSTKIDVDKSIHAKRWHKQHIGGAKQLGETPIEIFNYRRSKGHTEMTHGSRLKIIQRPCSKKMDFGGVEIN